MTSNDKHIRSDRMAGIERYTLANRSDPFARNRAITHTLNGVAGFTAQGEDAFYDAVLDKDKQNGRTLVKSVSRP